MKEIILLNLKNKLISLFVLIFVIHIILVVGYTLSDNDFYSGQNFIAGIFISIIVILGFIAFMGLLTMIEEALDL